MPPLSGCGAVKVQMGRLIKFLVHTHTHQQAAVGIAAAAPRNGLVVERVITSRTPMHASLCSSHSTIHGMPQRYLHMYSLTALAGVQGSTRLELHMQQQAQTNCKNSNGFGHTLMAVPRSPKLLCWLRRKKSSCRADSTTSLKSSLTCSPTPQPSGDSALAHDCNSTITTTSLKSSFACSQNPPRG